MKRIPLLFLLLLGMVLAACGDTQPAAMKGGDGQHITVYRSPT